MRHWNYCPEKLWIPSPWRGSRSGWIRLWATFSSGMFPTHGSGVRTGWSLMSLPAQIILWFTMTRYKSRMLKLFKLAQRHPVVWTNHSECTINFSVINEAANAKRLHTVFVMVCFKPLSSQADSCSLVWIEALVPVRFSFLSQFFKVAKLC